jgi:predicted nucleic acid-binding Zn ribbon protein
VLGVAGAKVAVSRIEHRDRRAHVPAQVEQVDARGDAPARVGVPAVVDPESSTGKGGGVNTARLAVPPRPSFSRNYLSQQSGEEQAYSWCCRCRQWLPVEAFRPNPRLRDGIDSWCKRCRADGVRAWRERNPGAVRAENERKRREYRQAHPLTKRPCAVCGKPFSKRPNAKVCSEECRRERKRQQDAERHARKPLATREARHCPVCGGWFETSSSVRLVCSEECRRQRKLEQQGRTNRSRASPLCEVGGPTWPSQGPLPANRSRAGSPFRAEKSKPDDSTVA